MNKRPSFQFYPADWLRDTGLRSCSAAARGLWMDILCFMHQGSPYGYLKVNHKVILPPNLARMCGLTLEETEACLAELAEAGVFEKGEDGVIFSRRMIRDEEVRNKRAACGRLGGNPTLKVNKKVDVCLTNEIKQKPTPSSSSSSSIDLSIDKSTPDSLSGVVVKKNIVDAAWIADLKRHYPTIDIDQELRNMDAWIAEHPQRRKTRRFVVGWLNRNSDTLPKQPEREAQDDDFTWD